MSVLEPCRLCGGNATSVGTQTLLGRHQVRYFQCAGCDLIFTERPHWLDEAYTNAISQLDTGAVQRNRDSARLTLLLATLLHLDRGAPCLDWGGGHGVFARMMRDIGLDFRWYDKHAENLFTRGFEGLIEQKYALVTSFEVWEHLADVRGDLETVFAPRPDFVFVGTVLHQGHRDGWWYYMLETGQHIVFYSQRTMEHIASRFGYHAFVGPEHTLFVRADVHFGRARRALIQGLVQKPSRVLQLTSLVPDRLWRQLNRYQPRVVSDHDALRGPQ